MIRVSSPPATMSRAWRSVSRVHTKAWSGGHHGWQLEGPHRPSDRSICGSCDSRRWSPLASACDSGAERLRGTAAEATNTREASSLYSNESSRIRQLWSTGSLTQAAHLAWEQVLQPGDTVVDATIGNGHDTLFLCRQVGSSGKVWGFDIQQEALEATQRRIDAELPLEQQPQLRLTCCCHSAMQEVVGSGQARLVSFNLGYLPGADKKVITTAATTVAAVEAALEVVAAGSLISIMSYTGHEGGLEEYEAVMQLLRDLSPAYWTVSRHVLVNRPSAPILSLVWRNGTPLPGRQHH